MQLFIIIVLIFLNAFFAATEIAFVSLNDVKIEKQAKEGNKKAKRILDVAIQKGLDVKIMKRNKVNESKYSIITSLNEIK